jgi:hypothetical protein
MNRNLRPAKEAVLQLQNGFFSSCHAGLDPASRTLKSWKYTGFPRIKHGAGLSSPE